MLNKLKVSLNNSYENFVSKLDKNAVLLLLIIASLATFIFATILNGNLDPQWFSNALLNFSTELMGAIVAFILFDLILGQRRQQEYEEKNRANLIQMYLAQMQSEDNALAQIGAKQLKALGCFEDGSLNDVSLEFANLEGASLSKIMVTKSDLCSTNFKSAFLLGAMILECDCSCINFERACLWSANLSNSHCGFANFRNTSLWRANLVGSNLEGVDLEGATFRSGKPYKDELVIDSSTVLPDGTNYKDDLGIEQLERFTNSSHPEFWRSSNKESPAYAVKRESKVKKYI